MANQYLHTLSDTWNSAMTKFFGIRMNVTNTNSDADSRVLEMQVGSNPVFSVRRDGAVYGVAGTAGSPTYSFEGDKDIGLYRIGADILGISVGGVERARVSTSAFQINLPMTGTAVVSSNSDVTAGRLLKTAPGPAQAFRRGNVLGTVSQSGGVPTGALFERGTGANGTYLRFPNNIQICWHALDTNSSGIAAWTFPAVFAAAPICWGTALSASDDRGVTTNTPTTTTVTLRGWNIIGNAWEGPVRGLAIGTWY
jgi:hypothetical protein